MVKYSVQYNQRTWQWNVVKWTRINHSNGWQGQAVGGFVDQHVAEQRAKILNKGIK